jgi:hypothetical protein
MAPKHEFVAKCISSADGDGIAGLRPPDIAAAKAREIFEWDRSAEQHGQSRKAAALRDRT